MSALCIAAALFCLLAYKVGTRPVVFAEMVAIAVREGATEERARLAAGWTLVRLLCLALAFAAAGASQ